MSKVFDFNALTQQTLETKLGGPENTVLHVTTPPERLIEQLAAAQEELGELWKTEGKTAEKARKSYELAAAIISCNAEGVTVTAEELRDTFKIYPTALAAYLTVYMDFINEFHNAKN